MKSKAKPAAGDAAEIKPRAVISTIPVWCRYDDAADVVTLVAHPENPNTHPDSQIALLAKIIRHRGWRQPITVSNRSGFIVKGHCRLLAALLLQVAQVPVERQDYATEAEEEQDLLADNKIAELAEMQGALLDDLIHKLDTGANDMDLTGFTAEELERLKTAAPPLIDNSQDGSAKGANYFDPTGKTAYFAIGEVASPVDYDLLKAVEEKLRDQTEDLEGDDLRAWMESLLRKVGECV